MVSGIQSLNKKYSIIYIDDEELDYKLLKAILDRLPDFSYELTWINSFDEGWNILKHYTFDVALIDFSIGAYSGVDLIENLGGRDAKTPMIMLTGAGGYDVDLASMQAGAYDYIDKSSLDGKILERSIRYVSETHQLEQELKKARDLAEAADQAKTQFLSNMSHDLRTPLNAIVGFSELLLNFSEISEQCKQYVGHIRSSGHHLTNMIDDLMLLNQFQSSNVQVHIAPVNLTGLLEAVIEDSQYAATKRDVKVDCTLGESLPNIMADANAVKRILLNITTSMCDLVHPGERVNLSVEQTSDGLLVSLSGQCHEEVDIHLMQMAKPLDISDSDYAAESIYSIGLSLAIAKRYAELHDLDLVVIDKGNNNIQFQINLPLKKEAQTAPEEGGDHAQAKFSAS